MIRVLVVEDERYVAESLVQLLRAEGFEPRACATAEDARREAGYDVVLADLRLPGMSGMDLLVELRRRDPALPVVLLTGHGTIPEAVAAMRAGAVDFLTKPADPDVVVERLRKAAERGRIERERDRLRGGDELIAESESMRRVVGLAERVAAGDGAVLLTGETGTGKELLAAYVHAKSPRRVGPLVKVNCGAVPAALFEAEFFGHVRGAFTGAHGSRDGYFAEADGGTLFLDEVGMLSAAGQAKLLRALESGEVRPVGGTKPRRVDVRVIAATNEDLDVARRDGAFREDLYHRLSVFPIRVPPLRERPEDLLALARRFASPVELAPDAERALREHAWPGNARELRNVIARARVESGGERITAERLRPLLPAPDAAYSLDLKTRVSALERELFAEALRRAGGKKADAARLLGFDPSNWAYHAKRLGLS